MQIRDVMTQNVECIQPNESLYQAARLMRDLDIGALPICDSDRLAGMITDRDIIVRSVAEGHDPRKVRVADVMTPKTVYCFEDQDVTEAARLMRERQIRRLVVLNDDKRLVGIVSLGDLAIDTGDEELVGSTLEAVSEPV